MQNTGDVVFKSPLAPPANNPTAESLHKKIENLTNHYYTHVVTIQEMSEENHKLKNENLSLRTYIDNSYRAWNAEKAELNMKVLFYQNSCNMIANDLKNRDNRIKELEMEIKLLKKGPPRNPFVPLLHQQAKIKSEPLEHDDTSSPVATIAPGPSQSRLSLLLEPSKPNASNRLPFIQPFRIKTEPLDVPETEQIVPKAVREEIIGEEDEDTENRPPPITTMKEAIEFCSKNNVELGELKGLNLKPFLFNPFVPNGPPQVVMNSRNPYCFYMNQIKGTENPGQWSALSHSEQESWAGKWRKMRCIQTKQAWHGLIRFEPPKKRKRSAGNISF
ncbi:hypothetical protein GCK72_007042 [Caenorhabditis remanei]|uniref:Uncharacterized protein n=1 Tax=Caenorhabditis remanei TaxID=31234 RepID=A0A6A5HKG2_CAERE|nr:hypothetical protein GCK72_007042 [Caenorhabditis remanei]KAF1767084.1 hypothetical protein GCK72_007042 [Caenorhabditis remanei]